MADFKIGEKIRDAYSGYLGTGQTMPDTTNQDSDDGPLFLGGTLQGLRINLVAKTSCGLPQAATLTMKLMECATEDGSFTDIPGASTTVTGATGGSTFAAGEEILSVVLPETDDMFIDANVACSATATGTYDIVVELVP